MTRAQDTLGAREATATAGRPLALAPGEGRVIRPLPGAQLTIKAAGADTGGALTVLEWQGDPGAGTPPGVHHRDDETIYFLEGECTVTVGAHTMRALAGSFVHIPKGTVHAFANAGAGTARALLFLAPAGFEEAMEELAQLPPGPRDMTTVASILRKYHTEPVSMA